MACLSRFQTFFIILVLVLFSPSLGRWANFDDASVSIEAKIETCLQKNGNYKTCSSLQYTILNEQGREQFSEYVMFYNADVEKIRIKKIAIKTDGREYPHHKWEDKYVSSADHLFEQKKQIKIILPRIKVGSVISFIFEKEYTAKDLPNYASFVLTPPGHFLVRSYEHTIHSSMPLMVQLEDPIDVLSMENKRSGTSQKIVFKVKRPFVRFAVSEGGPFDVSQKKYPIALVCSEYSWPSLAKRIAPLYEKVLSEPLPKRFKEIKEFALVKKDEKDQINAVTTSLINHVTYVSISSIGERLAPHTLKDIDYLGRGDCKDYAVSTTAILRAMGYDAHVVIVQRGMGQRDLITSMGYAGAFNHAMVKVVGKHSGRVYWIDPTNVVSMADGLFPDIHGRRALVLDAKKGRDQQIPMISPDHAVCSLTRDVMVDFKKGHLRCTGSLDFRGEDAVHFCMASVHLPYQQRKEIIYDFLGGGKIDEKDRVRLDMPDISERVVQDVKIGFDYRAPYSCNKTNVGWAIQCGSLKQLKPVLSVLQNQVGDLFLVIPRTTESRSFIHNVSVDNPGAADLRIDSPWFFIERKVTPEGNGVLVTMKIINKVTWISREDIQSEKYKNLKELLEREGDFKLVLKPMTAQGVSKRG